jgi:hypothetical protein
MEISDQLQAQASLTRYPLGRRLGGPQTRAELSGEESLAAAENWTQTPRLSIL